MARYVGPVRAVVFDWAGTIVDYGSCAPAEAFVEVFRRAGVAIDTATARGPMGKNKRDHISEIIYAPHVAKAWAEAHHGSQPTEADIDCIYAAFTPVQVEVVRRNSAPIPGALEAIAALRKRGIKVGSCSGYNPQIMTAVIEGASKYGLTVDAMEWCVAVPAARLHHKAINTPSCPTAH
jgi:phosphonoacetaldehyde hydrolase